MNVHNTKTIKKLFSGTTRPKASAAPGPRDRHLPGAPGALRPMLRRTDPPVHHQLHGAWVVVVAREGRAEDDAARVPDLVRVEHRVRGQESTPS